MITHLKIKVLYAVCFLVVSALKQNCYVGAPVLLDTSEGVLGLEGDEKPSLFLQHSTCLCRFVSNPFCINQSVRVSVGVTALQFLLPVGLPTKTVFYWPGSAGIGDGKQLHGSSACSDLVHWLSTMSDRTLLPRKHGCHISRNKTYQQQCLDFFFFK